MGSEWIGWLCSLILVMTIGKQLYKQWHDHTSQGVSKWLYIGQFTAEIGFIAYSWEVHNWVFVFTNSALLIENLVGLGITLHHRRGARNFAPMQAKGRTVESVEGRPLLKACK